MNYSKAKVYYFNIHSTIINLKFEQVLWKEKKSNQYYEYSNSSESWRSWMEKNIGKLGQLFLLELHKAYC